MHRTFHVAVGLLLGVLAFVPASRGEGRLFAAWHAAYGEPGATDTLTGRCDNTGADTLYLSFDPGDTVDTFVALKANVAFHAAPQDSFGDRWMFGGGSGNAYNVKIEGGPNESFHTLQPWTTNAIGGVTFDRGRHHGYLGILYAQDVATPTRLDPGKIYCFARVIIPHPPDIPLCHQPVCIEFNSIRWYSKTKEWLGTRGEQRFLSINSPNGSVCRVPRTGGAQRPQTWTPWKR